MSTTAQLFIDGHWSDGEGRQFLDLQNPATNDNFAAIAVAQVADLDRAAQAAARAFESWRNVSAYERGRLIKAAGRLLAERADAIAEVLTREQGKPLSEAKLEIGNSVALLEWFGEEARRSYGRDIPGRAPGVIQTVRKEPVGPTAAFTPWNFPVAQSTRKIGAALAAGCTLVLKGAEETPLSVVELVKCFEEAGVPPGVVSLVFGNPAQISAHLIPHPLIRKVSFTGSTPVGKALAALAGQHMKRGTFELGGHAPVIICADANLDLTLERVSGAKYRNAGQVCISPTRFLIEEDIYDNFVDRFTEKAKAITVGDGMAAETRMGPLANPRRIEAMDRLVADANANGASVQAGGRRIANKGNFFEPTVLKDVSSDVAAMNEEPFGPMALMQSFRRLDDAIAEANRLEYGLAAYAYTSSAEKARRISNDVETGMLSINHHGLGLPETPFGGVKDSGYGSEGGIEAVEAYQTIKFVSHAAF